jgi:virginiamycin B lyase
VLLRRCTKSASTIVRLTPDGRRTSLGTSGSQGGPILEGPAGEVWATGQQQGTVTIDRIAPGGDIRSFPIGSGKESAGEIYVRGLAVAGDGSLWVATGEETSLGYGYAGLGGELIRIDPDGTVTHFGVRDGIEPEGLTLGPDGNLWFTGIEGRYSEEHSGSVGVGYIGRMTPAGELTLFPLSGEDTQPETIAIGPVGRVWFVLDGRPGGFVSIAIDGQLGPRFRLGPTITGSSLERSQGTLFFGPEGDAWVVGMSDIVRVTPSGQKTLFRQLESDVGTVGTEGAIWLAGYGKVFRLVPGAPGIDVEGIVADDAAGTVSVELACGGSTSGCAGTLDLQLEAPPKSHRSAAAASKSPVHFVHLPYEVAAEARVTLTLPVPAGTFAFAQRFQARDRKGRFVLRGMVMATVTGGPTLKRAFTVPAAG